MRRFVLPHQNTTMFVCFSAFKFIFNLNYFSLIKITTCLFFCKQLKSENWSEYVHLSLKILNFKKNVINFWFPSMNLLFSWPLSFVLFAFQTFIPHHVSEQHCLWKQYLGGDFIILIATIPFKCKKTKILRNTFFYLWRH